MDGKDHNNQTRGDGHGIRVGPPARSAQPRQGSQDKKTLRMPFEPFDFEALKSRLERVDEIPRERIEAAFAYVTEHISHLGLDEPSPDLVIQWIGEIFRQQGIRADSLAQEMLNVSVNHIERFIKRPSGALPRGTTNPETTSQQLADLVKSQFACRKVFDAEVVDAHERGDLALIHLGDVDRPHDVFLTPDYLKVHGLPASPWSPESGPPKRANVLLAQMVRLTRELQRNFAGDIQWGYANTLMLPFTRDLNDAELSQFVQQLVFEFSQIDPTPGHGGQRIILDMDLDMPRYFESVPAIGPGGIGESNPIGSYARELQRFNEVMIDVLAHGDFKTSPFHAPRLVFHLNRSENPWSSLHQKLFELALRLGNPGIALSFKDRDFGALGRLSFNDPEVLQHLSQPNRLRGFSTNSVALNLPRLLMKYGKDEFVLRLRHLLNLSVAAHRQKRMFISQLMASGPEGPLHLLRHRISGHPFMKLEWAAQPVELIGLGEAARLATGSPSSPIEARSVQATRLAHIVRDEIQALNRQHKLRLLLADTRDESVSFRLANLDLRDLGQSHSAYIFHRMDQTVPIYSTGTNISVFDALDWKRRFALERPLHDVFDGPFDMVLFSTSQPIRDPSICQRIYREAVQAGLRTLRFAPDLKLCRTCHLVFHDDRPNAVCPSCNAFTIADYGYCVSDFSPVDTWCRGMQTAWRLRHRWDRVDDLGQPQLPL